MGVVLESCEIGEELAFRGDRLVVCSGVLCKEELLGQVPFMSVSARVKNSRGKSLSQ